MSPELRNSDLQKAEKRLIEKGFKKMVGDLWDAPIDQLKIDKKFCFRRSRSSKVLKSMAQDIKKKGILNLPIAIYSLETDEIVLAIGIVNLEFPVELYRQGFSIETGIPWSLKKMNNIRPINYEKKNELSFPLKFFTSGKLNKLLGGFHYESA